MPARAFADMGGVEKYMRRLRAANVEEVLVLGGGQPSPAGELSNTLQILESGLIEDVGFSRVGLAAHPEGHPAIPDDELMDVLVRKVAWGSTTGTDVYLETQFSFEAAGVLAWLQRVRVALTTTGVQALPPVRLGVAGPASTRALIGFAVACGVRPSLSMVVGRAKDALALASSTGPERFLADVAEYQVCNPDSLIEGLHFYPFGGFKHTLDWIGLVGSGRFEMDQTTGFKVDSKP